MKKATTLVLAAVFLLSLSASAESPYIFGQHFWREGANIDVMRGRPGWVLFFEDISNYGRITSDPGMFDKYKDARNEGHTVIVRLNYKGGDDPPPVAETDMFSGQAAYFAENLKDYAHIFVYCNENNHTQQYSDAYMASRYAIHAVYPHAYWVFGRPNDPNPPLALAGDLGDGLSVHGEHAYVGGLTALEQNAPSGLTKPLYIKEMLSDGPHRPGIAQNAMRSIMEWNRTQPHKVECAMKFVYFEYYVETASLMLLPMLNADYEDAAELFEATNSFANPYIVISNMNAVATNQTSALITFNTDIASTGQVEYWKDGDQEQKLSTFYASPRTSHSIPITGLEPGATYKFLVKCYSSPHPLTLSKVHTFQQIPAGAGRVAGTIRTTTNIPVHGAKITRTPGGYSVYSAQDGSFEMKGVPQGDWTLTISEAGIETVRTSANVTSGGTASVSAVARTKPNLLTNAGFENGNQYMWTAYGNGFQTVNGVWNVGPTPPHGGNYFVGATSTGAQASGGIYQRIGVTAGTTYTARAFTRVERENCPWGEMANRFGVDRSGGTDSGSGNVTWTKKIFPYVHDSGEWLHTSVEFTAASNYATIFLDYYQTNGPGRKINCYDDIGLFGPDSPAGTPVTNASDAKALADGTRVRLDGVIATSGYTDFTDSFYVENEDRSSGIMVYLGSAAWMVNEGNRVTVEGTMSTRSTGERAIINVNITTAPGIILEPVGMLNREMGGGDFNFVQATGAGQRGITNATGLNNVGLLVTTSGRVKAVGTGFIIIDDGSGVDVRVDTTRVTSVPSKDSYVVVTGISSIRLIAGTYQRLLKCRRTSDMVIPGA